MGPIRRGLILATLPTAAWAEVCDKERPDWNGTPVTAVGEAIALFSNPVSLILLLFTALAVRFRNQWGALAVCLAWTGWVSLIAFVDTGGIRGAALAEGCLGSPTLFIVIACTLCVAAVIYTAPRPAKE